MVKSVSNITSFFDLYLSRNIFAESTIQIKSRAIGWFVESFGDLAVGEVTLGQAEQYRKQIADRPGIKARTVNTYIRSLDPFFDWLCRLGEIRVNPFATLRTMPEDDYQMQPYTPVELASIIDVADDRWRAIVLLAACCSLRRSEILNLTAADIFFDKSFLWVRPKRDTQATWSWRIKNHRQAKIALPELIGFEDIQVNLHDILADLIDKAGARPYFLLRRRHYRRMLLLKKAGPIDWERRNCPWNNFTRDYKSLLKRSMVEPRRFHDLRGTYATAMINGGCRLKEVQVLMRHKIIHVNPIRRRIAHAGPGMGPSAGR